MWTHYILIQLDLSKFSPKFTKKQLIAEIAQTKSSPTHACSLKILNNQKTSSRSTTEKYTHRVHGMRLPNSPTHTHTHAQAHAHLIFTGIEHHRNSLSETHAGISISAISENTSSRRERCSHNDTQDEDLTVRIPSSYSLRWQRERSKRLPCEPQKSTFREVCSRFFKAWPVLRHRRHKINVPGQA